jgi:hypothetical protein
VVRAIIPCVNWRGTDESFAALLREAGLLVADASAKALERTSGEAMLEELRRSRANADRLVEDLVRAEDLVRVWDWEEQDAGFSSGPPVAKRVADDPYAFSFADTLFKMRLSFAQPPSFKITNFGMPVGIGFDPHCDCPSCMAMRFPPPESFDREAVWAGY